MTGLTSSDSSIAFNGFQNTIGGNLDIFLVKFNPSGDRLWATYYGGEGFDIGYALNTDINGNIYLSGLTSSYSNIAYKGFKNNFSGGENDGLIVNSIQMAIESGRHIMGVRHSMFLIQ